MANIKQFFNKSKGQWDFSNYGGLLENFQSDGIDYLYDLEPQANNLFYAGFFYETEDGPNNNAREFYNAQYRIRKITIPFPKMDVELHPILRTPLLKKVDYQQDIKIEWFEDVYHSVQQYHLDWIARWYSKRFDVLRCGVSGKFKQLLVIAFHYVNDADGPELIESPKAQPIMVFHLAGLVPKGVPDISFDFNTDGADSLLAIDYKCGVIEHAYTNEIGMGYPWVGKNTNINETKFVGLGGTDGGSVWTPGNFFQDYGDQSAQTWEQHRVTRSATESLMA